MKLSLEVFRDDMFSSASFTAGELPISKRARFVAEEVSGCGTEGAPCVANITFAHTVSPPLNASVASVTHLVQCVRGEARREEVQCRDTKLSVTCDGFFTGAVEAICGGMTPQRTCLSLNEPSSCQLTSSTEDTTICMCALAKTGGMHSIDVVVVEKLISLKDSVHYPL